MPNLEDPSWKATKQNIDWALHDQGADKDGQAKMFHALSQASLSFMGEFKNGFDETHAGSRRENERAVFALCCKEDERAVYNLGRVSNGQAPI